MAGSDSSVVVAVRDLSERATVAASLERAGHDVATVSSREFAAALADALLFDLLILDEAWAEERSASVFRRFPILLVVDQAADVSRFLGDDFIVRPVHPDELVPRAANLIAGGESRLRREELPGPGGMTIRAETRELVLGDSTIRLRPRECAVLQLLLARRGEVVRTETLLREAWGPGPSSSRNLVEAQISRLRSKLRGTEAEGGIITVSGVGYLIR
jgi:DNA-binding response OmpR family regulator